MVHELIAALDDSALALDGARLEAGDKAALGEEDRDVLVYAFAGSGMLAVGEERTEIAHGGAVLVQAGEVGTLEAGGGELSALVATVGASADRHAPLGRPARVSSLDDAEANRATGARSFQILFGPHNGSTRATLFAGYIPPGKAPWHYHLYDEIVWVPDGPGRLHVDSSERELGPGAAFRLRPRQLHIVENLGDEPMTIIGIFTPAGSPSGAYLMPDVAASYVFAG